MLSVKVYDKEVTEECNIKFVAIEEFDKLPESEIAEVNIVDELTNNLTYPQIQPFLYKTAVKYKDF
jgi:hypothetical protein